MTGEPGLLAFLMNSMSTMALSSGGGIVPIGVAALMTQFLTGFTGGLVLLALGLMWS